MNRCKMMIDLEVSKTYLFSDFAADLFVFLFSMKNFGYA